MPFIPTPPFAKEATPEMRATAREIADTTEAAAARAREIGQGTLAYLLDMATIEARQVERTGRR